MFFHESKEGLIFLLCCISPFILPQFNLPVVRKDSVVSAPAAAAWRGGPLTRRSVSGSKGNRYSISASSVPRWGGTSANQTATGEDWHRRQQGSMQLVRRAGGGPRASSLALSRCAGGNCAVFLLSVTSWATPPSLPPTGTPAPRSCARPPSPPPRSPLPPPTPR